MEKDKFLEAKQAASGLARRLKGSLHAVVLYGSVARGEERHESDIDILIILKDTGSVEPAREFFASRPMVIPKIITRKYAENITLRDYFWRDIIEQGVILYDDGTYSGIREKALGKGRAIPV